MNKKVFLPLMGALVFLMVGCFGPYEKKLPDDPQNKDNVNQFLNEVGEIQPAEKQTLQNFIARMAEAKKTEGYGYIRGTTVRQALEKEQRFATEQAELEARRLKEEEEKRVAYEQKKEEMASVCTVAVTEKTFDKGKENKKNKAASTPASFFMELKFENKSQKDLTSLLGKLEFRDSAGELVRTIRIPLDEEIKAGTTKTWGGDLPFNAAKEADVKMANTPLEELTTTWIPEAYTYSDGMVLRMPPAPASVTAPRALPASAAPEATPPAPPAPGAPAPGAPAPADPVAN